MVFYFSWGALGSGAKVQFSELVPEFGVSPLHALLFHLNLTDIFPPPILKVKGEGIFLLLRKGEIHIDL
jgi:hypothetical protein